MFTHVNIAELASLLGQVFIDFVGLHANIASFVDQVLMASLLVLCFKVHLVGSLDC